MNIRAATPDDVPDIIRFVTLLAEYERLAGEVSLSAAQLRRDLFDKKGAEVLWVEEAGVKVAFALFFHNFSTFLGRRGIYLEDLFVLPEHRGRGFGKALLAHLAAVAVARECGRLEWSVLDWNESAIGFYEKLGAKGLKEWTTYRLTGDALKSLAIGATV